MKVFVVCVQAEKWEAKTVLGVRDSVGEVILDDLVITIYVHPKSKVTHCCRNLVLPMPCWIDFKTKS